MKLIVIGGKQTDFKMREDLTVSPVKKAVIYLVDFEKKIIEQEFVYSPEDPILKCPSYSTSFRGSKLIDGKLLTCTSNEIVWFDLGSFEISRTISHNAFNDLHSVDFIDGHYYVTSTGLDCVLKVGDDGDIVEHYNLRDEGSEIDFSREWRNVSTKPHQVHPNYVFKYDDKLWVTRFYQGDVVSLEEKETTSLQVEERIHDGFVYGKSVYFTGVSGKVILLKNGKVSIQEVRLDMDWKGWCRGLHICDENTAFIGFSTIRATKIVENIKWLIDGLPSAQNKTRIVLFDLKNGKVMDEMSFQQEELSLIFSIIPVEDPLPGQA